jgi:hypothetical protein
MTLKRLLRKNRKYLLPNRLCKQPLATTPFIFDSVYITTIYFIIDLFLFFYERYFSAFFCFVAKNVLPRRSHFFSTEKLFFAQETERKVSKN